MRSWGPLLPNSSKSVFRFGSFELRPEPPTLYRNGQIVSITPKGLATLAVLVSRQGAPVSKEVLLATVWPDAVVEEASLSQNVYTLRKLLAPDFPGQNPIENIPRFGYRFTLPVTEAEMQTPGQPTPPPHHLDGEDTDRPETSPQSVEAGIGSQQKMSRPHSKLLWAIFAVAAMAAVGLFYRHWRGQNTAVQTTMPYEARQFTTNSDEDRVTAAGISPDGKLVAYADADGVVLRGVEDASQHSLPSPRLSVVNRLSWFPDQLHLVVSGEDASTGNAQVWKISVLGETPMLLRDEARLGVASHDGNSVAFTTATGAEAWVMGSSGENGRRVTSVDTGNRISILLWTLHDDGLLLESHPDVPVPIGQPPTTKFPSQGYRMTYQSIDLATGKPTATQTDLSMGDACLASNGDLIFSQTGTADTQEATSLWRSPLAASGAIDMTRKQLFEVFDSDHLYGFSCDSGGKRIAGLRKQGSINVYVGLLGQNDTQLTDVRRLSFDSNVAYPHGWSIDGQSVLYEATREGLAHTPKPPPPRRWQIYSQSLGRHDPEPLVSMSGSQTRPELTPDHHWLLFVNVPYPHAKPAVFSVSPQGGAPAIVPAQEELDQFRCPLFAGTCIVRTTDANGLGEYSALDPLAGKGKALFKEPSSWKTPGDWDVSPDGSTLVVNTNSMPAVPLHTVSLATGAVRDIAYHPAFRTSAVNWASDGRGFFVSNKTQSGSNLSYVDLAGHSTLLRANSIATWAVPSPNGRFLAFVDSSLDSNVWLLQAK